MLKDNSEGRKTVYRTGKRFIATLLFFVLIIGNVLSTSGDAAQAAQFKSFTGYVTATALNVRTGPSTKYKRVKVLRHNAKVTVTSTRSGWYGIKDGGKTRYVSAKYIKKGNPPAAKKPAKKSSFKSFAGYVTATALNVRTGPSTKYKRVKVLRHNAKVTVTSTRSGWYGIKDGGKTRYVSAKYIKKGNPPAAKKPAKKSSFKSFAGYVTATALNVRTGPGTKYKRVKVLRHNAKVTVTSTRSGWYGIKDGGKKRYVSAKYIKKGNPPAAKKPAKKSSFKSFAGYVTATALNVRTGPGTKYQRVKTLRRNAKVTVTNTRSGWYGIKDGGKTRYVSAKYIKKGNPPPAAKKTTSKSVTTPLDYSPVKTFQAYIGYDNLKVYQNPTVKSTVVAVLREKTKVTVFGQKGDWRKIRTASGKQGFIDKANLTTDVTRFNPPQANAALGIDVSHYNGTIDFHAVKAEGNSFIIMKASEGTTYSDSQLAKNANGALKAGLKINVYHFFRAKDAGQAVKEADHFAQVLRKNGLTSSKLAYLFVDVETTNGISGNVRSTLSQNVNVFLKRMRAHGYSQLGIYSSLYFFKTTINMKQVDQPQRLHVWIARYRGQDTAKGIGADFQVDIWQYTSNGTVKGVTGAVDKDVSYYNPNAL
ncbi:MAG: SH3 domain-containing protein [Sporolactobacillus sp.]|nr:SH3 domain-containing protein [Sporolactobacillus sp.]